MAVLHCFTEGMCSEQYITRWFCHRVSIPEHAYVNHFQSRQSVHCTTSMSQAAHPWPKRCCAVRHCVSMSDADRRKQGPWAPSPVCWALSSKGPALCWLAEGKWEVSCRPPGFHGWRLCTKAWSWTAFSECALALLFTPLTQFMFPLSELHSYEHSTHFLTWLLINLSSRKLSPQEDSEFQAEQSSVVPSYRASWRATGQKYLLCDLWTYQCRCAGSHSAFPGSVASLGGRVLWYRNTSLRIRRTGSPAFSACNLLTSASQWKYSATYKRQLTAWLHRFSNSSFIRKKEWMKLILKWHFI